MLRPAWGFLTWVGCTFFHPESWKTHILVEPG
jgi:hypothetical protein